MCVPPPSPLLLATAPTTILSLLFFPALHSCVAQISWSPLVVARNRVRTVGSSRLSRLRDQADGDSGKDDMTASTTPCAHALPCPKAAGRRWGRLRGGGDLPVRQRARLLWRLPALLPRHVPHHHRQRRVLVAASARGEGRGCVICECDACSSSALFGWN